MNFALRRSHIYKAVLFARTFSPRTLRLYRMVFLSITGLATFLFAISRDFGFHIPAIRFLNNFPAFQGSTIATQGLGLGFSSRGFLPVSGEPFLGAAMIAGTLGTTVLFFELFFHFYLKYPNIVPKRAGENSAEFFDYETASFFDSALFIARAQNEEALSINSLLWALTTYEAAPWFFARLGLTAEYVQTILQGAPTAVGKVGALLFSRGEPPLSEEVQKVMAAVFKVREEHKHATITVGDFLVALFETHQPFQDMLVNLNLDRNDVSHVALWYERLVTQHEAMKRFWSRENVMNWAPIGVEWVYGYPLLLSKFSEDLSLPFRENIAKVNLVGRQKIVEHLEEILLKSEKRNALLVAEPGIGKRTIVLGLAQFIAKGKAVEGLQFKRVLQINVAGAVAGAKDENEAYSTLSALFKEAVDVGNTILYIENLHGFVGGGQEGLGRVDITEIVMPYLEASDVLIIATSDPANFHRYISPRSDLLGVFETINIPELDEPAVLSILEDEALRFEASRNVFFSYGALKAIYNDANRYIQTAPFPEKGVNLIHDVTTYVASKKQTIIFEQDVHEVVTRRTSIPLGAIGEAERQKLIRLDEEMRKEIIGQEEAIKTVVRAMQRLRAGLTRQGKPAGVFLFVGPTGVGKTLTAKTLAQIYFGSEENMVRLDMSEYQTLDSTERLLGSLATNTPGQLASAVRDKPFSVLLLDEFEKAHKDILNVFLRIFDEGRMTDVFGRVVNFEQNVIIATSNAGAQEIYQMMEQGINPAGQKEKLVDLFIAKGIFRPELINRFDEVVVYRPLGKPEVKQIAALLLQKLSERLREQGYFFYPTEELIQFIADAGFDPEFGARPMNRAIQDKIESVIARKILEGGIRKAQEFTLLREDLVQP